MSLKDDKQQNIQMNLDFSAVPTGEARQAGGEETESSRTTNGPENPANTNRLMEEVCERENLKAALQQVKANKGSAGVDGMTVDRFKQRVREITRRAKGVSMETTMDELAPYMRGWRSYFGFFETPEVLIGLTRWVRLRLRAAMWRHWTTPRRRRAALLDLGVRPQLASNTAGSGRGPWYLARAKALSVGLSNAYFKSLGLPSLFEER